MTRRDWTVEDVAAWKGKRYRHRSGFAVVHCGHPTALRPYYVSDPDGWRIGHLEDVSGKGRPCGLVFRHLAAAKDWVEAHVQAAPVLDEETLEVSREWTLVLPADWPFERTLRPSERSKSE